jgi:hypothetical protein
MFATARSGERLDRTHPRVSFIGGESVAESVRELVARESEWCSFFRFAVSTSTNRIVLDVRVPSTQANVLENGL